MKERLSIVLVSFLLVLAVLSLSGCETVKGFATGVGTTAYGAAQDVKNTWDTLAKVDKWFADTYW